MSDTSATDWFKGVEATVKQMAEQVAENGETFAVTNDKGEVFLNVKALGIVTQAYTANSVQALVYQKLDVSDAYAKVALFISALMDEAKSSV